jgi:beta-lactamase regulating signal transducer with metallopeptidase domain
MHATLAAAVSALIGVALLGTRRWLDGLAPAAQARLLLSGALGPAVITAILVAGWMADLYLFGCHAHRCLHEHTALLPGALGATIGAAWLARVAVAFGRVTTSLWRSRSARRMLDGVATRSRAGMLVVPFAEPHAFVVGMLRPQIYFSQGLLTTAGSRDLPSVLAHERAHANRRDPLRRLVASLALAHHLPGVAAALERRLARAHEMAADADAARVIGDRGRIAEVLVHFARLRISQPALSGAASWLGGDLETRVRRLLAPEAQRNRPSAASLVGCLLLLLLAALAGADAIHSGGEILLRLLDR